MPDHPYKISPFQILDFIKDRVRNEHGFDESPFLLLTMRQLTSNKDIIKRVERIEKILKTLCSTVNVAAYHVSDSEDDEAIDDEGIPFAEVVYENGGGSDSVPASQTDAPAQNAPTKSIQNTATPQAANDQPPTTTEADPAISADQTLPPEAYVENGPVDSSTPARCGGRTKLTLTEEELDKDFEAPVVSESSRASFEKIPWDMKVRIANYAFLPSGKKRKFSSVAGTFRRVKNERQLTNIIKQVKSGKIDREWNLVQIKDKLAERYKEEVAKGFDPYLLDMQLWAREIAIGHGWPEDKANFSERFIKNFRQQYNIPQLRIDKSHNQFTFKKHCQNLDIDPNVTYAGLNTNGKQNRKICKMRKQLRQKEESLAQSILNGTNYQIRQIKTPETRGRSKKKQPEAAGSSSDVTINTRVQETHQAINCLTNLDLVPVAAQTEPSTSYHFSSETAATITYPFYTASAYPQASHQHQ